MGGDLFKASFSYVQLSLTLCGQITIEFLQSLTGNSDNIIEADFKNKTWDKKEG